MDVALAILLALAGGAVGGLLGVGGGILFVPTLAILLGNDQLEAEATSLADAGHSADGQEGVAAFAAKRPPAFGGA